MKNIKAIFLGLIIGIILFWCLYVPFSNNSTNVLSKVTNEQSHSTVVIFDEEVEFVEYGNVWIPALYFCSNCEELIGNANHCHNCGHIQKGNKYLHICKKCGFWCSAVDKYCSECGGKCVWVKVSKHN